MSMDLGVKTFSTAPDYFVAGTTIRITTAVKQAGAALPAHAPVILGEDGKLAALSAPTGGSLNVAGLYGIVSEDTAKDEDAVVYLTGEFFGEALALPTGVTAADVEVPLRNIGIFLK